MKKSKKNKDKIKKIKTEVKSGMKREAGKTLFAKKEKINSQELWTNQEKSNYSFENEEERLRRKLERFSPQNKLISSFNKSPENKEPIINDKIISKAENKEVFYDSVRKEKINSPNKSDELEK